MIQKDGVIYRHKINGSMYTQNSETPPDGFDKVNPTDTFAMGLDTFKELNGTCGYITIRGEFNWYEGLALPESFKVTGKPPTGILPSVPINENPLKGGLNPTSGPVKRKLSLHYNCCDSGSEDHCKISEIKTIPASAK